MVGQLLPKEVVEMWSSSVSEQSYVVWQWPYDAVVFVCVALLVRSK